MVLYGLSKQDNILCTKIFTKYCQPNKEANFIFHKQNNNKTAISTFIWNINHTFDLNSSKITYKPNSIQDMDFLKAFHIHKNYKNVINYDFALCICEIN